MWPNFFVIKKYGRWSRGACLAWESKRFLWLRCLPRGPSPSELHVPSCKAFQGPTFVGFSDGNQQPTTGGNFRPSPSLTLFIRKFGREGQQQVYFEILALFRWFPGQGLSRNGVYIYIYIYNRCCLFRI